MRRIGVVIPVFGHSRFLRDAVSSMESQVGVDVEVVIVCDGCPNTDTHQYLNSISSRRRRNVTVIRKPNGGLSSARNVGIEFLLQREVEFVYFLDADNVVTDRGLSDAVLDIERFNADWAYPNINSLGYSQPDWLVSGYFNPYILAARNYIEAGSLLSRKVIESGLRFDETMSAGYEDWDFWLSAAARGYRGVQSSGLGLRYRHRFESMIVDADRVRDQLIQVMREKHIETYSPENLAKLESNYYPRVGVVDVRSRRYFENSFVNEKPFEQLIQKINESLVPGGLEPGPELLFFADLSRVSAQKHMHWLSNVIGLSEDLCNRGGAICPIGLKVTDGTQFGIKLGCLPDADLVGVMVRKSLLTEVLKDSDNWFFGQIEDAGVAAKYGLTIIDEFPPRVGRAVFSEELIPILSELRQSCALRYNPEFHPRPHIAHGPDARFCDIAKDLPIYYHPQNPALNRSAASSKKKNCRKVGFVLPFGTYGGVERVAIDVAKVLRDRGCECHVFFEFCTPVHPDFIFKKSFQTLSYLTSLTETHWSSTENYQGTPGAICSEGDVRRFISMLMGMDEVVFCHSHMAIAAAAGLRKVGVRTSSYVHTFDLSSDGRLVGWPFFTIGYEHKLDRIYTCSPTMHDEMVMLGVPKDKLVCIPNATTFNVVQRRSHSAGRLNLAFVGRFDTQKGIHRLGPLVRELREQGVDFDLKLAGSVVLGGAPVPPELESFVVGKLDSREVRALLDNTDVLLLPSLWEGLPLTMLEAMARGVVPISSAVGDVSRVARECPGVVVVDWDDPIEVARKIVMIGDNLHRMQKHLWNWSKNNTWEKNISADAFM